MKSGISQLKSAGAAGTEPEVVQLGQGNGLHRQALPGDAGQVVWERFDSPFYMQWEIPAELVSIGFLGSRRRIRFCGTTADEGCVAIYAGGELECTSEGPHEGYALQVSKQTFQETIADMQLDWVEQGSWERWNLYRLRAGLSDNLRRAFRSASLQRNTPGELQNLLERLLTTAEAPGCVARAGRVPRASAIAKAAAEQIRQGPDHAPIRMSQICRDLRVSWRTLNYAFKRYYQMTPSNYQLYLRLHRVRTSILNVDSPSITDVATAHGFSHLGDFARYYRRVYGELPSETRTRCLQREGI